MKSCFFAIKASRSNRSAREQSVNAVASATDGGREYEPMSKNKKRKSSERASVWVTALLLLIFIPIIIMNTVLITKSYLAPERLPDVFGVKPVIVLSGSMSPVFDKDALIFIKETDAAALKAGDIICYMSGGAAITHRIAEVITEGGAVSYVTKGDANNAVDRLAVSPAQVEGVYIKKIDGLGGFAMFMQSAAGMILFIALPIALYLVYDIWQRRNDGKREKERADRLEKELERLRKTQNAPTNNEEVAKL